MCNNPELLAKILSYLKTTFVITPKTADRFVGLHITRDRVDQKLYLSLPSYIGSILSTFGMMDCNPSTTPTDSNCRLFASSSPSNEIFPYSEAVGSLLYLMLYTRPDISFAAVKSPSLPVNRDALTGMLLKEFLPFSKEQ